MFYLGGKTLAKISPSFVSMRRYYEYQKLKQIAKYRVLLPIESKNTKDV
jgi:hypothetical protein